MAIQIEAKHWHDFKNSAAGEIILSQLRKIKDDMSESISRGGCFVKGRIDDTAMNYALNTGHIEGICELLEADVIPEQKEEEDK